MRSRLTVNTAEAAIDGAAAGLGVTRVLSYQVAPAVADGRIRIVLGQYEPAPSPVSLIHAPQGLTPLKVRMALDFAGASAASAAGVERGVTIRPQESPHPNPLPEGEGARQRRRSLLPQGEGGA